MASESKTDNISLFSIFIALFDILESNTGTGAEEAGMAAGVSLMVSADDLLVFCANMLELTVSAVIMKAARSTLTAFMTGDDVGFYMIGLALVWRLFYSGFMAEYMHTVPGKSDLYLAWKNPACFMSPTMLPRDGTAWIDSG